MSETVKLSPRLEAAASFVRKGSKVADVGTDHAYLPIYLISNDVAVYAVASDVLDGPVERAAANVAKFPECADRITVIKANGLERVSEHSPDCVMICGMGGELIAEIISASSYVRDPRVYLILQPMTKEERLRGYLYSSGFDVYDEFIAIEGEKAYQIIAARYDGIRRAFTEAEALLGKINIEKRSIGLKRLIEKKSLVLKTKISGHRAAGLDASDVCALLDEIEKIGENL